MFKHLSLAAGLASAQAQNVFGDPQQAAELFSSETFQKAITQGIATITYNPLDDYGCWCNFAEKYHLGRGPAIDEYDAACKQMTRGYECAILDEPACVPWEETYQPDWLTNTIAVIGVSNNPESVVSTCTVNNSGSNCKIMACIIEGTFISQVWDLNLAQLPMNSNYKHVNGFDPRSQANCPVNTQIHGDADDACCGAYPNRRPFRFKAGVRECCERNNKATIYNSGIFQCCPDGSVQTAC